MENNSHIQFCVAYTLQKKVREEGVVVDGDRAEGIVTFCRKTPEFEDKFRNFENEVEALTFYKEILNLENLYTANFCKVIQTTE